MWFEFAGNTEWGQEDDISVVARQAPGGSLTVFTTPSGYQLLLVYMERISMTVSCSSALRSVCLLIVLLYCVITFICF